MHMRSCRFVTIETLCWQNIKCRLLGLEEAYSLSLQWFALKKEVGCINISNEVSKMAAAVPLIFSEFHLSEREKLAKPWKKWLSRLRYLLVAMAAIDK